VTVEELSVDLTVVGGGPGGYATALRAAGHGLTVALVESAQLGGTCLHRGCIPSKALLHVGTLADGVRHGTDVGVRSTFDGIDTERAGRFRDGVVARLHRGLGALVHARGIRVIDGTGRVTGLGRVEVDGPAGRTAVMSTHVVLATGSVPAHLEALPVDGRIVMTSDDALRFERIPQRAVVVGAGAVGMELASFWRSVGADVTIVELADRVLPLEDPASSAVLRRAFVGRGITVRSSTSVTGSKIVAGVAVLDLADGTTLEADAVLVAVGRRPRTEGSGAAELGLVDGQGYVSVDALGRTSLDGIWAVGDVTPTLALAHAAFSEGFVVADAAAGLAPEPVDHRFVPRVTYCRPEVASVGWTEPEAHAAGLAVTATIETLAGNARALIEGADGIVKLITSTSTGELLGAHLVGPAATELIAEASMATHWSATVSELSAITYAHPTLSESLHEAALAAIGQPFHAL
jgi:dihydrolipoamide dehydrogenase